MVRKSVNLSIAQRNLRRLRRAHGFTQEELDELAGAGKGRTSSYETGAAEPPDEYLRQVAPALRLSDWREIRLEPKPEHPLEVPFLVPYWGTVPCGDWEAPQSDVDLVEIPGRFRPLGNQVVAVKVVGESMFPLYMPGDIVPIKLTTRKQDGAVTLVQNEDMDLTLKIAKYRGGGWEFHSLNPKFREAKSNVVTMLGVAVHVPERFDPEGIRV